MKPKREASDYGFIFALSVGISAIILGQIFPALNLHLTIPGSSILASALVWYLSESLVFAKKINDATTQLKKQTDSIANSIHDLKIQNKVDLISNVRDAHHWEIIDDNSEVIFFNALWVLTHETFGDTFVRMISRGIKWRIVYFAQQDPHPNDRYENMKMALKTIKARGNTLNTFNLTIYKDPNHKPGTSFFLFKSGGSQICRIYTDLLLSHPSTGQVIPTFAFDCCDDHLHQTLKNQYHAAQIPENDVTVNVLQEIF